MSKVFGNMSNLGLTTNLLISHAENFHSKTEVISFNEKGERLISNWLDVGLRAKKLASALEKLNLSSGDVIGTIAYNSKFHLELLYAISGFGGIAHTINPRLFPDEIVYIINDAEDRVLFVDSAYIGILIGHKHLFKTVEKIYIIGPKKNEIAAKLNGFEFLEDLILTGNDDYVWPELNDESAAVLCYTSGTSGNPKGVLYSHKSIVINANILSLPDCLCIGSKEVLMPVTPMYHVNAWGTTYASSMVGTKLILPGPNIDGKSLINIINDEKVSISVGIPTIWEEVYDVLQKEKLKVESVKRILVGGAAISNELVENYYKKFEVTLITAWGMTETSPLLTTYINQKISDIDQNIASVGKPNWATNIKIVDDDGKIVNDQKLSQGRLLVKGPNVIKKYFNSKKNITDSENWFDTNDIGKFNIDGNLTLLDRKKDLIKSGGEWISSVQLEEIARTHPMIHNAAVIGVTHKKWSERPIIIVELVKETHPNEGEILAYFKGKVVKWQIPDAVIFVDEIPLSSTGKPLKKVLKNKYINYLTSK